MGRDPVELAKCVKHKPPAMQVRDECYMANKENSLAHTKWVCKYHIVFTPNLGGRILCEYPSFRTVSPAACLRKPATGSFAAERASMKPKPFSFCEKETKTGTWRPKRKGSLFQCPLAGMAGSGSAMEYRGRSRKIQGQPFGTGVCRGASHRTES